MEKYPAISAADAPVVQRNSAPHAAVQECRKFLIVAGDQNRVEKFIHGIQCIRAQAHGIRNRIRFRGMACPRIHSHLQEVSHPPTLALMVIPPVHFKFHFFDLETFK
jgi:hypothetical protein